MFSPRSPMQSTTRPALPDTRQQRGVSARRPTPGFVRPDSVVRHSTMASRPVPSSPSVSARMSAARRADTSPELALRSALHRRGYRFRLQRPLAFDRRRRADIVFPKERVAVFVDGCFWHSCPQHGTMPKANRAWWEAKLERNRERDADTDRRLADDGWCSVRVWEHEAPESAADRVIECVRQQREALGLPPRSAGCVRRGERSATSPT